MPLSPEFIQTLNAFVSPVATTDHERLCLATVRIAAEYGRVSADDLRCVELTKPDADKRAFGGVMASLSKKGVLVVVGETTTAQRGSNSRPIKVFALAHSWRSAWMSDDRLPVPLAIVDLKAETRDNAQIPVSELFAILARCHTLAASIAGAEEIAAITRPFAAEEST